MKSSLTSLKLLKVQILDLHLDDVFKELINQLHQGVVQSKHPFHITQLATVKKTALSYEPEVRSVVFKEFRPEIFTFVFHTDARSPKFVQIKENQNVCLHFYDSTQKHQVRVKGIAEIAKRNSELYLNHKKNLSLSGLRCYMGPYPPSADISEYHSNIQDQWLFKAPSNEDVPEELENFEVISVKAKQIDYLRLRAQGHIRCKFTINEGRLIQSQWVAP